MKRHIISAGMLLFFLLSCKKNTVQKIDTIISGGAQIKYFNFATSAPSINFYANDAKVSAIASATGVESVTGTAVGSVYPALNYSTITAGAYTFKAQIPSTATADANLSIATLPGTLENNKYYSLYTSGIYNATTKSADAFVLEDKLPLADNNTVFVRFVNAISNAPSALNLVFKNATTAVETVVATNIAYKGGSDFISVPVGVYELYVRYPNGTTNVISRNGTSIVSYNGGRAYTVTARGDITITSTTLASRPQLDNTANK